MTTGEGGMMTVQDEDLAVELESLKNFGIEMDDRRTSQSMFVREGINGRITEFQGLLGTLELERVGERIARRNELAAIYRDKLSDSEFKIATVEEGVNPHYKLIVETEYDVDEINEYCEENNVSLTGEVYQTPVHKQPIFETSYQNSDFPVANQFAEKHFCPPLYPELTESDVDYVCEVLTDAISN
jgi:dTDP-4-amino-4,6-dideoxygalactose transaminase